MIKPSRFIKPHNQPALQGRKQSLLLRPVKLEVEHNLGYRLRLAHVNGLNNPEWLHLGDCGVKHTRGLAKAKWCPRCLAEQDPIWRACWDGGPAACMKHQCWLVDVCPACNRPTTWHTVKLLSCRCGHRLPEVTPMGFSEELVTLQATPYTSDEPEIFWAALGQNERWHIAHFLGALHEYGLHGKPLKKASSVSVETERRLVTVGAEILTEGTAGIQALLERIRTWPAEDITVQLIGEAFPGLLVRLRKGLSKEERACLLPYLRFYLQTSAHSATAVIWRESDVTVVESASRCAQQLRIRPERVPSVLSNNGVSPKVRYTATGRKMLVVGNIELQQVRSRLDHTFSARQIARRFGLSPFRQAQLIKAGMLRLNGMKVDGASVERLLQLIVKNAEHGSPRVLGETLSVSEALRVQVPRPVTVPFIQLLVDGEVEVMNGQDGVRSFADLHVSREQLANFLDRLKTTSEELCSVPNAAHQLKLKQEVLYHLINVGLIGTVVRRVGRRSARFVSQHELKRFTSEIAPLVQLAARADVGNRASVEWARSQGFEFVSGPGIDGGRQYFIRIGH